MYLQTRHGFLAVFLVLFLSYECRAEVRIVSWNIANLAGEPGVALRGQARSEADYAYLKLKLSEIDADVVALQEIGSLSAARSILGDGYEIVFETRCMQNAFSCEKDDDDIYTAIAYRNGLGFFRGSFQIDALAIDHTDECGVTHKVRGAPGVILEVSGKTIWIPSLHIKAACKDNQVEDDTQDDCDTQRKQYDVLARWISERPSDDIVILAGDMNRKLLKPSDHIRKQIFEERFNALKFLPDEDSRTCWNGTGPDIAAAMSEARCHIPEGDMAVF